MNLNDKRGSANTFSSDEARAKKGREPTKRPSDVPAGNPLSSGENERVDPRPRPPKKD